MTRMDAYEDDMGDLSYLSDREIDRLLAGNPAVDGPEDDLAGLVRDLRGAYLAPPSEATRSRHLAAMAEAARVAESEDNAIRSRSEKSRRRPRAHALKEAAMTRIRTASLAAKLAAATLVAVLATGGLAAAGVISLPNPLPEEASDTAKAVHGEIDGSNPSEERCGFGLHVAEVASDGKGERPAAEVCEQENGNLDALVERGKGNSDSARGGGNGKGNSARGGGDVSTLEHGGAHPDPGAGQRFGESVSDSATDGEPQQGGRAFGESVSGQAQETFRPEPPTTPQGGGETGEGASQQGQQTGGNASQGGRETAGGASGGSAP